MTVGRIVFKRMVKGARFLARQNAPMGPVGYPMAPAGGPLEVKGKLELVEGEQEFEGYELPKYSRSRVRVASRKKEVREGVLSAVYPLVPRNPKKGEPIYSYVTITWDQNIHNYVYNVTQPILTPKLKEMLPKLRELIEEKLDVDFNKLKKFEAKDYLMNQIDELMDYFEFEVTPAERLILRYYIERDFIGLGHIEPLMIDENIEDISCDGVGVPIFLFHREPKLGSIITNLVYDDSEELDSFITRLAQLCGKSISVAKPLLDGALPDGSRLQATLATDIARRGSNFTIRKFTRRPMTPVHLFRYGTLDLTTLSYLWMMVDYGSSMLISGGTASGKTTMLNVLSLFIRKDKKIVSIEDTAELQLPHPHWIPAVARTAISTEEEGMNEVDLFALLKESFRQRPDYIIVGEVRGKEAYILFQQMATGHPSIATIHAENFPKLMDRLTTKPIDLSPGLISSLDMIAFMGRMKYKNKFVRKVTEVLEVVGFDDKNQKPITKTIFKWDSIHDKFEIKDKSYLLKKIADKSGMTEKEVKEEMQRRMAVLMWMKKRNLSNYKDVNKLINAYYNYPERIMSAILESS